MVNVNIASHVSVMFQHYIHNLEPISHNDNDAATICIRNSEYPYICKSLDSNSFLQNQGKFPMRTLTDGHVFNPKKGEKTDGHVPSSMIFYELTYLELASGSARNKRKIQFA